MKNPPIWLFELAQHEYNFNHDSLRTIRCLPGSDKSNELIRLGYYLK